MTHRFKQGSKYSGEVLFGGCGQMDSHIITIVKRTKGWIYFQEKYGDEIRVKRKYLAKWGEYCTTGYDRFFAYAVEGGK
jgi:hypothetical protein